MFGGTRAAPFSGNPSTTRPGRVHDRAGADRCGTPSAAARRGRAAGRRASAGSRGPRRSCGASPEPRRGPASSARLAPTRREPTPRSSRTAPRRAALPGPRRGTGAPPRGAASGPRARAGGPAPARTPRRRRWPRSRSASPSPSHDEAGAVGDLRGGRLGPEVPDEGRDEVRPRHEERARGRTSRIARRGCRRATGRCRPAAVHVEDEPLVGAHVDDEARGNGREARSTCGSGRRRGRARGAPGHAIQAPVHGRCRTASAIGRPLPDVAARRGETRAEHAATRATQKVRIRDRPPGRGDCGSLGRGPEPPSG